jgi:hypothetical protein
MENASKKIREKKEDCSLRLQQQKMKDDLKKKNKNEDCSLRFFDVINKVTQSSATTIEIAFRLSSIFKTMSLSSIFYIVGLKYGCILKISSLGGPYFLNCNDSLCGVSITDYKITLGLV